MPNKHRQKWQRPFKWPPSTWEFTPGLQRVSDIITCLIFLVLLVTVAGALITWPFLIGRTFIAVFSGSGDELRNTLLAVAALVGVPFLIWRTLIASKQTEINRESHYTALFTKAVEQLGAEKTVKRREFKPIYQRDDKDQLFLDKGKSVPVLSADGEPLGEYVSYELTVTNYEVRLGAIYALERIAQDSKRDSRSIYLTLCAYLQNNAVRAVKDLSKQSAENNSDTVEIIHFMSRYAAANDDIPGYEFVGINIPNLHVFEGSLSEVVFRDCSQKDADYSCDIASLQYLNCNVDSITIHETGVDALQVIGGNIRYFKMFAGSVVNTTLCGNSETIIIHTAQVTHSRIHLGSRNTQFNRSEFVDCQIIGDQPRIYTSPFLNVSDSSYRQCSFSNCDMSSTDMSNCEFENCVFIDCNLVNSGITANGGNRIERCLTNENLYSITLDDIHASLRSRWIEFQRRNPPKND